MLRLVLFSWWQAGGPAGATDRFLRVGATPFNRGAAFRNLVQSRLPPACGDLRLAGGRCSGL